MCEEEIITQPSLLPLLQSYYTAYCDLWPHSRYNGAQAKLETVNFYVTQYYLSLIMSDRAQKNKDVLLRDLFW